MKRKEWEASQQARLDKSKREKKSGGKVVLKKAKSGKGKKLEEKKDVSLSAGTGIIQDFALHSTQRGRKLFEWLIGPHSVSSFYEKHWEKKPLHISRSSQKDYFAGFFSKVEIDRMLRTCSLQYSSEIDLTKYENDQRYTLNPKGEADADTVWRHFQKGCSVRLLCPQKHCDPVCNLLAALEAEFGSMVGANTYLTPPKSQGFAPHYDDIEAFILQLEGSKTWRIYAPKDEQGKLPRKSSRNFKQNELPPLLMEVTLGPGDLLYFPRGFVHQAVSDGDTHSLHMTVSCGAGNAWVDLLDELMPHALARATQECTDLRRGLPCDYLRYMGIAYKDADEEASPEDGGDVDASSIFDAINGDADDKWLEDDGGAGAAEGGGEEEEEEE
jgi:lysine-specific demethylase/histidyl-hydroxylase NO66